MNFAIIVAAGKSTRMGKNSSKVLLPLLGRPMICHAIKSFQDSGMVDEIIVVAQKDDVGRISQIRQEYKFDKIKKTVAGGNERQCSVYNGVKSIKNAKKDDIVIVHNGSNPIVAVKEIEECIKSAKKYGAAVAGFRLKDTIKRMSGKFVEKTLDRNDVYQVQTPQAIKYGLMIQAFENAKKKSLKVTDDVSLVEALGKKARIVECSCKNIKVTTPDDLEIAEGILAREHGFQHSFRIGIGQDSHEFSRDKGKKLVLGGFRISSEAGFEANSDGDVVLHALFNAVSSAIGEKSLGFYSDEMCRKGMTDSREYLKVMLEKMERRSFKIRNVSVSIEAGKPKLEKYTDSIKKSLSKVLGIDECNIGITYTSGESLTSFGQGRGMQCFAAVSLSG